MMHTVATGAFVTICAGWRRRASEAVAIVPMHSSTLESQPMLGLACDYNPL